MRATVVIPTYRRAERLRATLECLTRQDCLWPSAHDAPELARVVVCDDGSPDHTADVARAFEDRLPLMYAWQEDRGFRAGQARNLGIARAVGDVVVFIDDDVLVRPDFVAQHLRAHEDADGHGVVAIGYRHRVDRFDGAHPSEEEILVAERDDRLVELDAPVSVHPTPWVYVYSCNFSVTLGAKELWFDEGFAGWGMEDTELGYRLWREGYRIVEADRARVLHVEDPAPRDPFRCEIRELPPSYDSYVVNAVYFMDKHAGDETLRDFVRKDLRWYVLDDHGRFVKNGYANDVDDVIARCRERLKSRGRVPAEREGIRESA